MFGHFDPLSEARELTLRKICSSCRDVMRADPVPFSLEEEQRHLNERRVPNGGDTVSVRRDLQADLVVAAWPTIGEACLLCEEDWPVETPKSTVHAPDSECFMFCNARLERGMSVEVHESEIFVNQLGEKVLNGAMGVDKLKVVICNLVPFDTYNRKLGGDSDALPQSNFLSRIIFDDEEALLIDGED